MIHVWVYNIVISSFLFYNLSEKHQSHKIQFTITIQYNNLYRYDTFVHETITNEQLIHLNNNILLVVPRGKCGFANEERRAGRWLVLWWRIHRTRSRWYRSWRGSRRYRSTGRTRLIYYGFGVIGLDIILLFHLILLAIWLVPLILRRRLRPCVLFPRRTRIPIVIYLVLTEIWVLT